MARGIKRLSHHATDQSPDELFQVWNQSTGLKIMHYHAVREATDRQARLLACACARQFWDELHSHQQQAIEVAESMDENYLGVGKMVRMLRMSMSPGPRTSHRDSLSANAFYYFLLSKSFVSETGKLNLFRDANRYQVPSRDELRWKRVSQKVDETELYALNALRDIIANPYDQPRLCLEQTRWKNEFVKNLAQSIYVEQTYELIPALGDALEDAGCDDEQILNHCRSDKPHFRGCWVLDLLLGKS